MSDTLRRSINVATKIVSKSEGLVDYVASDATLDCYREVIDPKGWRFTHFEKNAPFVDSHNYWSIKDQLGKVVSFKVEGGKLIERVKWAIDVELNAMAQLGWKMTEGDYLKAVSVGFIPTRYAWQGGSGYAEACAALNLDVETIANCQRVFLIQEQIELSACIIGANPNALAKAHKDGCVKDADLAAIGFGDEDMHFVRVAGKAIEKSPDGEAGELLQLLIGREMGRITGKTISGKPGDDPGTDAGKRAAAEEAERRAVERGKFLKQLEALCES